MWGLHAVCSVACASVAGSTGRSQGAAALKVRAGVQRVHVHVHRGLSRAQQSNDGGGPLAASVFAFTPAWPSAPPLHVTHNTQGLLYGSLHLFEELVVARQQLAAGNAPTSSSKRP